MLIHANKIYFLILQPMKANKYVVWALVILPSLVLLASGVAKIMKAEEVMKNMGSTGFAPYIVALGLLEVVITLLFIYPATRRIGFYLVCSYLGGAIAIHINGSMNPAFPAVLLSVIWVAAYLSLPNFLSGAGQRAEYND